MYLKHFFKDTNNTQRHPFKTTNNFTPPIPDNINLLEYISLVLRDIKTNTNHNTTRLQDNLSHEQWESLTSLHKNDELIVKPADKGGAIVIWPRELYLTEAYKQLNNNLHYKLIQNDPFPTLIKNINQFTNTTYKNGHIDYTTHKFLLLDNSTRNQHYIYCRKQCRSEPRAHTGTGPGMPGQLYS